MPGSVTPIAQPVLMSPAAPWASASRFGNLASRQAIEAFSNWFISIAGSAVPVVHRPRLEWKTRPELVRQKDLQAKEKHELDEESR